MSLPIDSLQSNLVQRATQAASLQNPSTSNLAESTFQETLRAALEQTSSLQNEAQTVSQGLLTGETDSVHSVVLAAERADLAVRLTLQVRNKVLDAYNEIMHMQI